MIKRLICLLCVAVTAAACNRPRNIPDEKLIAITREIFLANAYRDSPKSGFSQADTVDFYTPIFEKYGYKPSDLSYTINNLSRRKSVRFTDILEEVARRLDREDSLMKARIATLDTVDSRTMNRYRRVVYSDACPIPTNRTSSFRYVRDATRSHSSTTWTLRVVTETSAIRTTSSIRRTARKAVSTTWGISKGLRNRKFSVSTSPIRKRTKYGSAWRPPRPTRKRASPCASTR
jgi:hypothetical protein